MPLINILTRKVWSLFICCTPAFEVLMQTNGVTTAELTFLLVHNWMHWVYYNLLFCIYHFQVSTPHNYTLSHCRWRHFSQPTCTAKKFSFVPRIFSGQCTEKWDYFADQIFNIFYITFALLCMYSKWCTRLLTDSQVHLL